MIPEITPVSVLKANASQILNELDETGNPVVITQNGKPMGVLVSIEEYSQKEKSLALLKIIAQSSQAIAAGDHKPADEVIERLRRKVRVARNAKQ